MEMSFFARNICRWALPPLPLLRVKCNKLSEEAVLSVSIKGSKTRCPNVVIRTGHAQRIFREGLQKDALT